MDILFEDNHVIVVIKPQNIPSMPDESGDKDMLTMVKEYIKEKYNKPGNVFVGLVHRLDRPTGGIMVFAKTSKAASRLSEQIKSGDFKKTYYTICKGIFRDKSGTLINYLKKNEKTNTVSVVPMTTTGAKKAELKYTVLQEVKGYSLVEVKLISGRGHQIRVQLSHLGYPIVGDQKYGGEGMAKVALNLFAGELVFNHPTKGDLMRFRAYPPVEKSAWNLFDLERFIEIR